MKLYPNPTTDQLTIEVSELSPEMYLSIHNLLGQQILHQKITAHSSSFKLKKLAKGSYILSVFKSNKNLIKQQLFQKN